MRSFEGDYVLTHSISHDILMMARAVGEEKGKQGLFEGRYPEMMETLRRIAVVQSVESSNRIEGVTVAPGRLQAIVEDKTTPQNRSEAEVAGYRDVLNDIHTQGERLELTPDLILDFHKKIFERTGERGGFWKERDNAVIAVYPDGRREVRFNTVPAVDTPRCIAELCRLYHQVIADRALDPLIAVASFVFDFTCIHPFGDGNGRMSRLLTLLLLYQAGYRVGRYVSLERVIEDSKETYYEALHLSSQGWHEGAHDLEPWWSYFLGTLLAAYRELGDRVGTITAARGAKTEMVLQAFERMPGNFTMQELARACPGVSQPTLKRVLKSLEAKGKVRCARPGRGAIWEKLDNNKEN